MGVITKSLVAAAVLLPVSALAQPVTTASPDFRLASDIAAKLLPPGALQRGSGVLSGMMGNVDDQVGSIPLKSVLKAAGLPEAQTARLSDATVKQVMDILDPAYRQRMKIVASIMLADISKAMTAYEPEIRKGLARAYTARFTPAQLGDIDAFLKTPSGTAFAAQQSTIMSDPAVTEKMRDVMPAVMKAMLGTRQKIVAATASLPKPKTAQTLTSDDRARLARLLGVPNSELIRPNP